jgi:hypothetical protein
VSLLPSQFKSLRLLLESLVQHYTSLEDAIRSCRQAIASIYEQDRAKHQYWKEALDRNIISLFPAKHEREENCAKEQTRHRENYCEQRSIKRATWFTGFCTLLAFAAAAYYAYEAHRQLAEMICQTKTAQAANKFAQDSFHQDQRAWVGIAQVTCVQCSEEPTILLSLILGYI